MNLFEYLGLGSAGFLAYLIKKKINKISNARIIKIENVKRPEEVEEGSEESNNNSTTDNSTSKRKRKFKTRKKSKRRSRVQKDSSSNNGTDNKTDKQSQSSDKRISEIPEVEPL